MAWVAKRLRGDKVWVECDAGGQPIAGEDQRVDVLYKKGGKRYRAAARNLTADEDTTIYSDAEMNPAAAAPPAAASPGGPPPAARAGAATPALPLSPSGPARSASAPANDRTLHVYTDGACTGNPGPMGLGVVILDLGTPGQPGRREISEYLGMGTNNIAELTAIHRGLEELPRDRPVVVYSDSAYAIGLLSQNWKAKANQELVARLRQLLRGFSSVRFVKVAGHAGVPENERCDELARTAILGGRR